MTPSGTKREKFKVKHCWLKSTGRRNISIGHICLKFVFCNRNSSYFDIELNLRYILLSNFLNAKNIYIEINLNFKNLESILILIKKPRTHRIFCAEKIA